MSQVFISYRRADSADVVGRIYEHLAARLGEDHVFKDVECIPVGEDFREAIGKAIAQTGAMLVVIGPDWLARDENGRRRIDDPDDYVRTEIETALTGGARVVPVLVRGAAMPAAGSLPESIAKLSFRNAIPVRPDPDFATDMARLLEQLPVAKEALTRKKTIRAALNTPAYGCSLTITLLLLLAVSGYFLTSEPWQPKTSDPPPGIQGRADIIVLNGDRKERDQRSISYPGLLPVQTDDRVRLEVDLNGPAYVYMIWISPSGQVIPVYPWKRGSWEPVVAEPVRHLRYPSADSAGVPMKANVEGREIFLVLARKTPLPQEVDLQRIIQSWIQKLPTREPAVLVRFEQGELVATQGLDRDPDFFNPAHEADPFRTFGASLSQELAPHFEFIDGYAFVSSVVNRADE